MVLTVLSQKFTKYCLISLIWPKHRQRSGGGGGGGTGAKILVWYRKHFYDCWHRRAHTHSSTLRRLKNYLKSTMNQDRLNKLEQLPKDALSQIDYWHRWKNVCLCQLKTPRVFWKIWVAVCPWLSGRWAPPRQFKTPAASENELNEEGAKVSFMQRICVTVFLICYPCRLD